VFFTTDSLDPVARRIGYLVGASTGKKGRGIVPIFGRPSYGLEMLQQGCLVVILKMAGEEDPGCYPLWVLGSPPKSYSAGFVTGSKTLWACRCW
jgi:hypothetical protein